MSTLSRAIIHLDDYGMSRSTNRAVEHALLAGWASSASVMVPCPWFRDAAAFAAEHPELCIGVHLTFVCEWPRYKWRPVVGSAAAPSLCDELGYMLPAGDESVRFRDFRNRAVLEEVRAEAGAQVQMALACGMRPSHLDYHCGSILASSALRQVVYELAQEFGIPAVLFPRDSKDGVTWETVPRPTPVLRIERLLMAEGDKVTIEEALSALRGSDCLAYVILHPAERDDELRAICLDEPFGAEHRAADLRGLQREPLAQPDAPARLVSCREAFAAQRALAAKL